MPSAWAAIVILVWSRVARAHYSAQDVIRMRGQVAGEHSLAGRGASQLWGLLHSRDAVVALGAATGKNAVQPPRAGSQAIYLPGEQMADENPAGRTGEPGDGIVTPGQGQGRGRGWSRSWRTQTVRPMRSN